MLRYILFDTTLFGDAKSNAEQTEKDLMWCLEALVKRNQNYLNLNPRTPPMYKSGIVYKVPAQFDGDCPEVQVLRRALGSVADKGAVADALDTVQQVLGGERFRDIGRIIENGGGDCDNVASWRVAELRQAGIQARPWMTKRQRPDGGTTYHALVQWPPFGVGNLGNPTKWTSEDPSLLLGMGGASRAKERNEELRKNQERCEIMQKYGLEAALNGGAGVSPAMAPQTSPITAPVLDFGAEWEEVLGLRRGRPQMPTEIPRVTLELDKILSRERG